MGCAAQGFGGVVSLNQRAFIMVHSQALEIDLLTLEDTCGEQVGAVAVGWSDLGQERSLWTDLTHGSATARSELIRLYQPYVRALAARCYARRMHNAFEFDEYLQFATLGMLEAMEKFQPERGVPFKAFAAKRIMGAMLDGLETLSEQQQQVAWRKRLLEERHRSIAEDADLDDGRQLLAELGAIGAGIALGFILDGTGMIQDAQSSLPDNAYANTEAKQLHQLLWKLINGLPARDARLMRLLYQQQLTFEEAALTLKITKGRVSQLHKQIILQLRSQLATAPSGP